MGFRRGRLAVCIGGLDDSRDDECEEVPPGRGSGRNGFMSCSRSWAVTMALDLALCSAAVCREFNIFCFFKWSSNSSVFQPPVPEPSMHFRFNFDNSSVCLTLAIMG